MAVAGYYRPGVLGLREVWVPDTDQRWPGSGQWMVLGERRACGWTTLSAAAAGGTRTWEHTPGCQGQCHGPTAHERAEHWQHVRTLTLAATRRRAAQHQPALAATT